MTQKYILNNEEIDHIFTLTDLIHQRYQTFDQIEFLNELPAFAHKLPAALVKHLTQFKYMPHARGYTVVSGFPVDDVALGATPSSWSLTTNNDTCWRHCIFSMLCSSILGEPFAWLTQQDGRLIHDVLPMKIYENEQLGCGSKDELTWHTEDAFHELRGDYLVFMCLRNHDGIPTTVGRPDFSRLSNEELDILFEPQFVIRPDHSHLAKNESQNRAMTRKDDPDELIDIAYQLIEKRQLEGDRLSVLFGCKKAPYLRVDPYFMTNVELPAQAQHALDKLVSLIDESIHNVTLQAGEIAIFDNYKVVHGRRSFAARYDGTDRWFKRINVTRDLRKSRHVRTNEESRTIY